MFTKKPEPNAIDLEYFSIFDTKMGHYTDRPPITAQNTVDLIRAIEQLFRNPEEQQKNQLFTNAEDFQIFKIGTFNKKTATIAPCHHECVLRLYELKSSMQMDQKKQPAL